LADRFGGKWLFGGCILLSSVASLLSPAAARLHLGAFLLLRIVSGLGAGFMFPALHALVARWSAPANRSFHVALLIVGTNVGVVVGMLASGVLCDHGFAGGWPSVFYVFGAAGCLWAAAWFLVAASSPSTHPRISAGELRYWERAAGCRTDLVARPPTPWRRLLTSVPVWALALAFFANDWGFYTMATCIPLFMHDVLGFDMTRNGALSAVPFVAGGLMIPAGRLADWLRARGGGGARLSTSVVRKSFLATGFLLSGGMLVLTGYAGCDRALAVALVFLAVASTCVSCPVVAVNPLDLAPLHAGKVMGLACFAANLAQIAAPHAVGALTYRRSTRHEWQTVFYLAAAVYAVGAVVFLLLGSGDRQQWDGAADKHNAKSASL